MRVRDSQEWSGTRSRFSAAGTPEATGNPSNATPDRALSRCPRSSPPGACGNSARAAPRARPSWPRNRAGSSPRQRRRSRPRSAPTAGGRKTHDPASAASPPSPPSSPPDDPSAVHRHRRILRSNQNIKESDQAACVQCRLRQRAVKARFGEAVEIIIPPPKNAIPSPQSKCFPSLRDRHIVKIQTHGRMAWQSGSGYNQRSRIETQMGRWKAIIGQN